MAEAMATSIAALRAQGAAEHDALRFRYIEALARRAATYDGSTRDMLDAKLATALAACRERCANTSAPINDTGTRQPRGATRLGELLARLSAPPPAAATNGELPPPPLAAVAAATTTALKSVQLFGAHWARLGVEQQLAQALAGAPENAGPLNSHLLVLRTLERLRDTAPDYLYHFVAYADALCWLEDAERALPATQAALPGERKRRSPARSRR